MIIDPEPCSTQEECDKIIKEKCLYVAAGLEYWQLTAEFETAYWYRAITLLSGLIFFIFFFLIWYSKELQAHPMKLFMWLTMFEACE